jgi:hypothetical protein
MEVWPTNMVIEHQWQWEVWCGCPDHGGHRKKLRIRNLCFSCTQRCWDDSQLSQWRSVVIGQPRLAVQRFYFMTDHDWRRTENVSCCILMQHHAMLWNYAATLSSQFQISLPWESSSLLNLHNLHHIITTTVIIFIISSPQLSTWLRLGLDTPWKKQCIYNHIYIMYIYKNPPFVAQTKTSHQVITPYHPNSTPYAIFHQQQHHHHRNRQNIGHLGHPIFQHLNIWERKSSK